MKTEALWMMSETAEDVAGNVAPTAEWVEVVEDLPGGRARVRRAGGEELVLTWGEDLFADAQDFPDNVPIVLPDDCLVDSDLITAAVVSGGIALEEARAFVDPDAVMALHEKCPDVSLLDDDEVAALAAGRA